MRLDYNMLYQQLSKPFVWAGWLGMHYKKKTSMGRRCMPLGMFTVSVLVVGR